MYPQPKHPTQPCFHLGETLTKYPCDQRGTGYSASSSYEWPLLLRNKGIMEQRDEYLSVDNLPDRCYLPTVLEASPVLELLVARDNLPPNQPGFRDYGIITRESGAEEGQGQTGWGELPPTKPRYQASMSNV